MGQPKTTNQRGNKVYQEKDVNTLARRLITDMPGLSSNYARVMADDALNIEENYQVTYSFKVNTGTATLSTFKVVSTIMADERVSFRWLIIRVSLTYKAQIQNTIHSPARRRINFLNRRRCSYPARKFKEFIVHLQQLQRKLVLHRQSLQRFECLTQIKRTPVQHGSLSFNSPWIVYASNYHKKRRIHGFKYFI